MLSYSTQGLPHWPLEDLFVLVRQFGYEGIEIALRPEQLVLRSDEDFWRETAASARAAGLTIIGLHLGNPLLYTDPNEPRLLHPDPEKRRFHVALIQSAFEIAARLNCRCVTAASGAPVAGLSKEAAWERLLETVGTALETRPPTCDLLIEHEPEHFIRTSDDIIELHERSGGQVWSLLDVGHVECVGEPIAAAIEKVASLIRNVHLEDIKNQVHKHLLPGEGDIDFKEVKTAFAKIGYAGPMTVDLYPFANAPITAMKRAWDYFGK